MSDGLALALATHLPIPLPVFSPLQVSGMAGWWDASDLPTITDSGGAVSQWDDKSGEGNHVSQGTAANQPKTGLTTINGLNALDFTGGGSATGDWLEKTSFSKPDIDEFFFVIQIGFHTANAGLLGNSLDKENIRFDPSDSRQCRYDNDTVIPGAPGDPNDFGSGDGQWNPAGITGSVVADLTLPNNTPTRVHCTRGNNANENFNSFRLGGDPIGGGRYLTMKLCELIAYNVTLSAQARSDIREYLRVKWGVL